MPKNTPPGTLYRRALRRADRRSRALIAHGRAESIEHGHPLWSHALAHGPCRQPSVTARDMALLTEACRLSNALAVIAYGTLERAATDLLHRSIAS